MDKQQAKNIIKDTFDKPFDINKYKKFINELLNHYDKSKSKNFVGNYIKHSFINHIKHYTRLGRYTDADKNIIDILTVCLKKESSIEKARTMQRNFITGYLNGKYGSDIFKDGALVAFYHEGRRDWRFSFIKVEYKPELDKDGKVKNKELLTPAKRYSFLVGEGEPNHTAKKQLIPLLENIKNDPSIYELEDAFSVEKVTKEFFENYRNLFIKVTKEINTIVKNNNAVKTDFNNKGVETVDFAKKMLGQIIFLYFLQKKGWFGVGRDDDWGTGSKTFLRDVFNKYIKKNKNFFNDILENLFYIALATYRQDNYYDKLNCKIPFLNGGLFDPINNYDWIHTDIFLSNELFSNHNITKEGDVGDGVFDVFDRFNFTVKEDEPLEKEVAVDPEMLGKIFEKLSGISNENFDEWVNAIESKKKSLETKFNKKFGVYYTPREIVHYMCQESLINYLATEFDEELNKNDIELLIRKGVQLIEHDKYVELETKNTKTYKYEIPESIRNNAERIDGKLENIRICDPAVGSGAFPVGMMNEIVKARVVLETYIKSGKTKYDFKRHVIHENLFGVDIDPSAVEIAKLRLWLSLIVDEDDIKKIKPLPNLDYKIMQGNSLLEEYEGVKLFNEKLITYNNYEDNNVIKEKVAELHKEYIALHSRNKLTKAKKESLQSEINKLQNLYKKQVSARNNDNSDLSLFQKSSSKEKAEELQKLHEQFFNESRKEKKDEIKEKIEQCGWDLIEITLKEEENTEALKKLENLKTDNKKPFFLWKLHFTDVFQEKGGFDIVIANPPYIQLQKDGGRLGNMFTDQNYSTFKRTGDIYMLFYEKGINVLKNDGHLVYITSNKWMRAGYGDVLRGFFTVKNPVKLLDFAGFKIFESATVDTNIIIVQNTQNKNKTEAVHFKNDYKQGESIAEYVNNNKVVLGNLSHDIWFIGSQAEMRLKEKIEKKGKPLKDWDVNIYRGVLTGYNEAFIIDEAKRAELIADDPKSDEIIKPILRGRDIKRYSYNWAGLYLIATFPTLKVNINKYPAVKKYLKSFGKKLHQSGETYIDKNGRKCKTRKLTGNKWYETQDQISYYPEFAKEKIVWQRITQCPTFCCVDKDVFILDSMAFFTGNKNLKYFTSVLNSKIIEYYIEQIVHKYGDAGYRLSNQYVEIMPIPNVTIFNIKEIESLVDKILAAKKNNPDADTTDLENQIDIMVYKLYDLTYTEACIIDPDFPKLMTKNDYEKFKTK